MDISSIKSNIISLVEEARVTDIGRKSVYHGSFERDGKNEFLMFIKPEAMLQSVKFDDILDTIFDKIDMYGLKAFDVSVLSSKYLERHNIIANHYGVINAIAKSAVVNMSDQAKDTFHAIYGKSVEDCNVLGGIEFHKKYSDFKPLTLDFLWQNKKNKKLAGGTYCVDVTLDGEKIYLINGFHPRQLLHFTETGRSIVTLSLHGDIDWETARREFIGATRPQEALEGSLRNIFLKRSEELGLAEVSQGLNIVHLSAGAVEGLVELLRYNTNYEEQTSGNIEDYKFGRMLKENFDQEKIDFILGNNNIEVDNKVTSVFDVTEELNSDDAMKILQEYL